MICVIQRVLSSSVSVGGRETGRIGKGLNVLLCAVNGDSDDDAGVLAEKIPKLRIFEDQDGKNNLSLMDKGYEILLISNFTLAADCRKGNRPSYFDACPPEKAGNLYERFFSELEKRKIRVKKGIFGADMKVEIINDGPVTLVIDSNILKKGGKERE